MKLKKDNKISERGTDNLEGVSFEYLALINILRRSVGETLTERMVLPSKSKKP